MENKTKLQRRLVQKVFVVIFVVLCLCHPGHGAKTPCTSPQWVGVENPSDYTDNTDTSTGKAYMLSANNLHIGCCGVVKSVRFYATDSVDFSAHVWRPTGVGSLYELIGETQISAGDVVAGGLSSVAFVNSPTVDTGDLIGWSSTGTNPIPYNDVASDPVSDGVQSQAASNVPAVGGQVSWTSAPDNTRRYAFGAWLDESTAPYFTNIPNPAEIQVPISLNVGDPVFTLSASDVNQDDVDFGLNIDMLSSSTYFEILDPATGVITVKSALVVGEEDVEFTVTDQCETTSLPVTIKFIIEDDIPEILTLPTAAFELREDETAQTVLHVLECTDDGPLKDVDCSCPVDPSGPFIFDGGGDVDTCEFQIIFQTMDTYPLDADVTSLYNFSCTCNDGTSDSVTRPFQVSITKNEEPDVTIPTGVVQCGVRKTSPRTPSIVRIPIAEITVSASDLTNGTTLPELDLSQYASDPTDDDLTWTLDSTDCPFKIDESSGKLYTTDDMTTYKQSPCAVTVTVSDGWNDVTKITSILITEINTPPTLIKPPGSDPIETTTVRFDETTEDTIGYLFLVYELEATDPDLATWDEVDFSVEWTTNGGEEYFDVIIDKTTGTAEIWTKVDMDYEKLKEKFSQPFYADIVATDSRGESSDMGRLEIIVQDVNEKPEWKETQYKLTAYEDSAGTILACPYFSVKDPDNGDFHTFTLDCGSVGIYHIDGVGSCVAVIKMSAEHDLDAAGVRKAFLTVECTVQVEDRDGLTADNTANLEIEVHEIDDNDPELEQSQYTCYVTNNTDAFTIFCDVGFTDDNDVQAQHKEHLYKLSGTTEYGIDADGNIYNIKSLNGVPAPDTDNFWVTVTDNAGHTDSAPVTVNIMPSPTTTTSTTTTTEFPSVYSAITDFTGDTGNLIWVILASLLGALFLGLLTYTCVRCLSSPGACSAFRGGNCFGRGRPCFGKSGRVGGNARHSRAQGPLRTQKTPPRGPKDAPPKEQPARRRRLFDCFDRKNKDGGRGARDPAKPDEGRTWEAWKDDFETRNWVG